MIINGVELEADFLDAEFMERYENGLEVMRKDIETYQNFKGKRSEEIRKVCESVFLFFDSVFGEGTAKKIFGNSTNLNSCVEAYEKIIEVSCEQNRSFSEKVNKYSPERVKRKK